MKYYRDTWVEVNLDRIKENVKNIKAHSGLKKLFAVVKADGYGHGDIQVAKAAIEAGATHLAVATLDEALRLRRMFHYEDILLMGPISPRLVNDACKNHIDITIHDYETLVEITKVIKCSTYVHIKLNTGMNRIGINSKEEFTKVLKLLKSNHLFKIRGLFTHFSIADDTDTTHYEEQLRRFQEITSGVNLSMFELVHLSNSASLVLRDKIPFQNAARLGIAMYGLEPNPAVTSRVPLQQAISWKTTVTQINRLPKGEKVGYGGTYTTQEEEIFATCPIGYADGFLRYNQNRPVMINGNKYHVTGRVCMDQMMIKVDDSVKLFDTVDIINDVIKVDDMAKDLKTINYEIVCAISKRVPRVYKSEGKVVETINTILL